MSPYETAEHGFGPLIRLSNPAENLAAVNVRKAPYGADIIVSDGLGDRRVNRLTRTEIVRLAAMLAELGIDPTNETDDYRARQTTNGGTKC